MSKPTVGHTEIRWALQIRHTNRPPVLVGRHYWKGATDDEPGIKTFRIRAQAREARAGYMAWGVKGEVVKVRVTVEVIT